MFFSLAALIGLSCLSLRFWRMAACTAFRSQVGHSCPAYFRLCFTLILLLWITFSNSLLFPSVMLHIDETFLFATHCQKGLDTKDRGCNPAHLQSSRALLTWKLLCVSLKRQRRAHTSFVVMQPHPLPLCIQGLGTLDL